MLTTLWMEDPTMGLTNSRPVAGSAACKDEALEQCYGRSVKRVERTGAAAMSFPSKKRTNGVYKDRRIILDGLALGSEPDWQQEGGPYI